MECGRHVYLVCMDRLGECHFLSISSISVPSGSSMNAINGPFGPSLKGSSVIVTLFLRIVVMVFSMFSTSNARWSNSRFS